MKSFSLIFRSCCWLRRCWNFSFPIQHRHFTYQIVSSIQQQRRSLAIFISISSHQLEHLTDYEARHNRCHQRRRTHQHSAHYSVSRSRSVSLDLYTFLAGELSEAHSPLGWRSPFPPGIDASSSSSSIRVWRYLYMSVMEEPIIPPLP